ncbi:AbiJ-NTD4 domain-containing protein [Thiococcus pfennigii]|uniref:AbiJ-NTD4 domain-containing protein n=1 Tax=Thiococcus pfennigii TaxID=1057 RepID=UPI00190747A8|nr:hypothetical protein [Thiococcus pfennigii]
MLFSQRIGKRPITKSLQLEGMDEALRNTLWTIIYERHISQYRDPTAGGTWGPPPIRSSNLEPFIFDIWYQVWQAPSDTIPQAANDAIKRVREYYFECEWYAAYDILQLSIDNYNTIAPTEQGKKKYISIINAVLEKQCSGYRVINSQVTPIADEAEISSLEAVHQLPSQYTAVEKHFKNALSLFADRKSPDYSNAVKEAVCAIESLAKIVTGDQKATLGKLTSKLGLHPALQKSLSQLYGYTSDEHGVRHGSIQPADIDFDLAKFFLVSASSFINYILARAK